MRCLNVVFRLAAAVTDAGRNSTPPSRKAKRKMQVSYGPGSFDLVNGYIHIVNDLLTYSNYKHLTASSSLEQFRVAKSTYKYLTTSSTLDPLGTFEKSEALRQCKNLSPPPLNKEKAGVVNGINLLPPHLRFPRKIRASIPGAQMRARSRAVPIGSLLPNFEAPANAPATSP